MKRNTFFFFRSLIIAVSVVISVSRLFNPTSVQALGIEQSARRWVCLDHTEDFQGHDGHNTQLSAGNPKPLPGTPAYVFVCIGGNPSEAGINCTTGNDDRDYQAIGLRNNSALGGAYGYNFEGMNPPTNPVTPDAGGGVGKIIWHDSTSQGQARIWMVLQEYHPGTDNAGGAGGLQNGDFSFETAKKKCVVIGWDPFGRVFDPTTLEPVMGAVVTLYYNPNFEDPSKPQDFVKMYLGEGKNPVTTKVDGVFNFLTVNGEYKLQVDGGIAKSKSDLHQNYKNIYFDDKKIYNDDIIYLADTGKTDMGKVIIEKDGAQLRDIPIYPSKGTNTLPEVMETIITAGAGDLNIQGRVSHPFTVIVPQKERVYTDTTKKSEVIDIDSKGYTSETVATLKDPFLFSVTIDQTMFENTPEYVEKFYGVVPQKTDLTLARRNTDNSFIGQVKRTINTFLTKYFFVQAATRGKAVRIDSIPSYLEGYAYDATGKIIPKATVGIYLKGSQKSYYTTQADVDGHFQIGSEFIPPFNYDLRYGKLTGETVTVSTSKYLVDNHVFLAKNNISTYTFKATTPELIAQQKAESAKQANANSGDANNAAGGKNGSSTSKYVSGGTNSSRDQANGTNQTQGSSFGSGMQGIVMIIAVIFVLLMVGVGAFIMMKSKQSQTPQY